MSLVLVSRTLLQVINHRDKAGNTPLMLAVEARNLAMCKALVTAGADTNLVNNGNDRYRISDVA